MKRNHYILISVILTVIALLVLIYFWFYYEKQIVLLEKDDLWGYQERNGKIIIAPKYIFAEEFSRRGIAAVCDPEDGWLYIDRNEKPVIKPYYIKNNNDFDRFSEGLARFEKNGKMGFFNPKGKVVIEPQFEYATRFENNFAAVGFKVAKEYQGELEFIKAEQWGFIDKKGVLVIPYRYEEVVALFNKKGKATVIMDGKKVLIDSRGEVTETLGM